jgi:hypothetical protein
MVLALVDGMDGVDGLIFPAKGAGGKIRKAKI